MDERGGRRRVERVDAGRPVLILATGPQVVEPHVPGEVRACRPPQRHQRRNEPRLLAVVGIVHGRHEVAGREVEAFERGSRLVAADRGFGNRLGLRDPGSGRTERERTLVQTHRGQRKQRARGHLQGVGQAESGARDPGVVRERVVPVRALAHREPAEAGGDPAARAAGARFAARRRVAVLPEARGKPQRVGSGLRPGDDVEHPAHPVRAVDGRAAAAPDLDAVHPEHGQRRQQRGRIRLGGRGIPERRPVHHDGAGLGRQSPKAEGELLSLATGLMDQRAGHSAQALEQEPLVPVPELVGGKRVHVGPGLLLAARPERGGHHHRLADRGETKRQLDGVGPSLGQRDFDRGRREFGGPGGDQVPPLGDPLNQGAPVVTGGRGEPALSGEGIGDDQGAGRRSTVRVHDDDPEVRRPGGGRRDGRGRQREGYGLDPGGTREKTHEPALLEARSAPRGPTSVLEDAAGRSAPRTRETVWRRSSLKNQSLPNEEV